MCIMASGHPQVACLVKRTLKAKDIEALENRTPIVAFGLTGTETMNCPPYNSCYGTHNCPTLSAWIDATYRVCNTLNLCGTTFTGLCM